MTEPNERELAKVLWATTGPISCTPDGRNIGGAPLTSPIGRARWLNGVTAAAAAAAAGERECSWGSATDAAE